MEAKFNEKKYNSHIQKKRKNIKYITFSKAQNANNCDKKRPVSRFFLIQSSRYDPNFWGSRKKDISRNWGMQSLVYLIQDGTHAEGTIDLYHICFFVDARWWG